MTGRGDAGATSRLVGVGRLLDRAQGLLREVRAIPIKEHHEGWCGRRRRRGRWRSRFGLAELIGNTKHRRYVVVLPAAIRRARISRTHVTAIEVDPQVA